MSETKLLKILDLCIKLDKISLDTYLEIASSVDNNELKKFWQFMANDEKTHFECWTTLYDMAKKQNFSDVFDNEDAVVAELEEALRVTKDIKVSWKDSRSTINDFMLAYRLEFYILHPAFEIFFNLLRSFNKISDCEDIYKIHITRFLEMFAKYNKTIPDTAILVETLHRLWKENKVLAEMATIDSLTGTLNRRGFLSIVRHLSYFAQRNGEGVGVLMIDIDDFKIINDMHGHSAGDRAIKTLVDVLKTFLRKSDVVGRYGGDEFIVFLPNVKEDSMLNIVEKIRTGIETSPSNFTISIGATQGVVSRDIADSFFALFTKADRLLYLAKKGGKNRVEFEPINSKKTRPLNPLPAISTP